MNYVYIIILVVLALSAVWLLFSYVCWRIVFRRGRGMDIVKTASEDSPYQKYLPEIRASREYVAGLAYEEVNITSKDGLRLSAKLYAVENPRALLLLFHGYRSKAENDFSCAFNFYLENRFSLLLVDQRAHGQSEGKSLTFGIMERWDCLNWARWAAEHFPGIPLILDGMSMGSSTVLMASDLPLPESVCAIIADCGYTSPEDIIKKVIRDLRLPTALAYPPVRSGARIFGGFSLDEHSASQALKNSKLPVFFLHGESDSFVPCSMSCENFNACGSKKVLVTVPNAEHGLSYLEDRKRVQSALTEFFEEVLAGTRCD